MATYELYYGGPQQLNTGFQMFPSAPFSVSENFDPAVQQQPVCYAPPRNLDFTGFDSALSAFLKSHPLVTNDILGSQVIPEKSFLTGVWWKVAAPVTGLTFSLKLRVAATTILAATSASAVTDGFVILSPALYFTNPEMLDVILTAVPAGGVTGLSLQVAPLYFNFRSP